MWAAQVVLVSLGTVARPDQPLIGRQLTAEYTRGTTKQSLPACDYHIIEIPGAPSANDFNTHDLGLSASCVLGMATGHTRQ